MSVIQVREKFPGSNTSQTNHTSGRRFGRPSNVRISDSSAITTSLRKLQKPSDQACVKRLKLDKDREWESSTISRRGLFGLLKAYLKQIGKPNGHIIDISQEQTLQVFQDAVGNIKSELTDTEKRKITKKLRKEMKEYEDRLRKCNYVPIRFEKHHSRWADTEVTLPSELFLEIPEDHLTTSQEDLSPNADEGTSSSFTRTEYRHIQNLSQQFNKENQPVPVSLKVAARVASNAGKKSLKKVLDILAQSPTKAQELEQSMHSEQGQVQPYSADEALALILKKNLSKETYLFLRNDLNRRNFKAFPAYDKILKSKKACRPDVEVTVTDVEAFLPLDSLLIMTVERIVKLQGDGLVQYVSTKDIPVIHCILECSWGYDGSTGHSLYKQKCGVEQDDHSLIATTVIPLQLRTSENAHVLWHNPAPQSPNYCRPLHLQFRKETNELIHDEYRFVNDQIQNLKPHKINIAQNRQISITFTMNFSIIDGKVLSIISGTSCQNCPYCKAKPTEMNDIDKVCERSINKELLNCGMSPLHAWIRSLEFLLNLGYKNHPKIRKWSVRKVSAAGKTLQKRKLMIRKKIKNTMGLIVDQVKAGGSGTTNDGNTARRALSDSNRSLLAEILGLDQWLLDSLHAILTVISSGLPVDAVKFGEFCKRVAHLYVQQYNWYYMPVTIHKLLVHGEAIIKASFLPIGCLSEQAGESRNKLYKQFREHHTRKCDRKSTMSDLFHRSWDCSDPYFCDFFLYDRQKYIKRYPLSKDAMMLLKPYNVASEADLDVDEGRIDDQENLEENPCVLDNQIEQNISLLDHLSC